MKFKLLVGLLILTIIVLIINSYFILERLDIIEGATTENSVDKKYCEQDSDCVWGFRTDTCCSCPKVYNMETVEKDKAIIFYEEGKDYSSVKNLDCSNIWCAPCGPYRWITKLQCLNNECHSCIPEGGGINPIPVLAGDYKVHSNCCEGWTPVTLPYVEGGKKLLGITWCIKCGDGLCRGEENNENCPEDCLNKQGVKT
ncbi:hypothetical protein HYT51_01770 [Candidatus Woesearchaeota archaeon]|nr:hypothetical protein [Candidatus Woesearchaeota archaeon]